MNEAEERVASIDHHPEPTDNEPPPPYHFKNDDAHLSPSRWWFASSAFPMIAGTLGPAASAFSICALARPWLQYLPPGQDIQNAPFIADPPWLTIVNAIQLAVAILSNIFLLLNMTRRVGFSIAQPITIVGWYISAICLLALNVTVAGPFKNHLHPADDYILAQAFYYGIWATILYFVDASLMLMTFWGASTGHYDKDFMLTPSQRTLMLQTIMLMLYLLIGALIFSTIEGWSYLDAVYWADVTLFTVGFGDFSPSSTLARALLIPYALIGIISLGLVITSIRSFILERGKRHLDVRGEEKNRRRTVRTMTLNGNDDILNPIIQVPSDAFSGPRQQGPLSAELERRKAEFELMRKIQRQASARRKWIGMAISTGSWLLLWFVGAVVFVECERPYQPWTYFDAFYFCFVSFTTIGYGDLTPISNAGKSFFVFWSLLALPTMTVLISNAGDTVVRVIRDATIRIGSVTILPSDEGFIKNLKYVIHQLSCRQLFTAVVSQMKEVDPEALDELAGFRGPHHKYSNDNGCDQLHEERLARMNERATDSDVEGTSSISIRRAPISRLHNALDDVPSGPDFHVLLLSEIQTVARHVRGGKRRRYTYEEWAWYLRLLGEDERNPGTHRKVGVKPKGKKHRATKQVHHDEEGQRKWSWVGVHSPLMGSKEESEWILEKLVAKLKTSLSAEMRSRARPVTSGGWHDGGMASAHESSHGKRECKRE